MPDLDRATTSHLERKNGSLRQCCKRLARLTYAYSKKWEQLDAALALHFAYYDSAGFPFAVSDSPPRRREYPGRLDARVLLQG